MGSELKVEASGADAVQVDISSARSLREAVKDSSSQSMKLGGQVALVFMAIPFFTTLSTKYDYKFNIDSDPFWDRLTDALYDQATFYVPIAAVVFGLLFLVSSLMSVWRQRPLQADGRLELSDGEIAFWRTGLLSESRVFKKPLTGIEYAQVTPIELAVASEVLPDDRDYEVTVVTDDDMHVVARGLTESDSEKLVSIVEDAIPG